MAKQTTANQLAKLVRELRAERSKHLEAVARIDETFAQLGIAAQRQAGRAAAAPSNNGPATRQRTGGTRRRRGRFKQTGEQSVLTFIQARGGANSAEVNAQWRKEGRRGKANNTLTKLVQEGQLKRVAVKGERGGRYEVV